MRTGYGERLLYFLLLLFALSPLIATAVSMSFMPETVALHYGLSGPDRFGPKVELFIAAGILTGTFIICWLACVFAVRLTALQPWKSQSPGSILFARVLIAVCIVGIAVWYMYFLGVIYADSVDAFVA